MVRALRLAGAGKSASAMNELIPLSIARADDLAATVGRIAAAAPVDYDGAGSVVVGTVCNLELDRLGCADAGLFLAFEVVDFGKRHGAELVEGGKCGCHVVGRLVKVGRGWNPAGGGCLVNGDCELAGFVADSEPSAVRGENVVASAKAFDVVADCHSGDDLSALLVALAESEFD